MIEIAQIQKKGIVVIVIIGLMLGFLVTMSKAKKEGENSVDKTMYKTIDAVPGCEFSVDRLSSDTSTAVMEISKSVNFLDYETYTFRNGEDLYLIFNMENFIVIAKKGTTFNFSQMDVSESFSKNSLQGIWFEARDKVEKKGNTYTVDVLAQVVITNTLYNDFAGKLVTIEQDGQEWALFAGYVKEDYAPMVDYVSTTFKYKEENLVNAESFEVNIEEGITIADNSSAEREEISENQTESQVAKENAEKEEPEKEEQQEDTAESTETSVQEQQDTLVADSTIREVTDNINTAYSSNIYSMLPQGSIGYMDIFNEDLAKSEGAYIKITGIYDEQETQDLISAYEKRTNDNLYQNFEVPDNCHLEAMQYDVRYTSETYSYVNIKLTGLDGDVLRYRGMPYDAKTYDIPSVLSEENDWISGNMVFYIVPDGCMDYALSCSGIMSTKETRPAWFYISTRE